MLWSKKCYKKKGKVNRRISSINRRKSNSDKQSNWAKKKLRSSGKIRLRACRKRVYSNWVFSKIYAKKQLQLALTNRIHLALQIVNQIKLSLKLFNKIQLRLKSPCHKKSKISKAKFSVGLKVFTIRPRRLWIRVLMRSNSKLTLLSQSSNQAMSHQITRPKRQRQAKGIKNNTMHRWQLLSNNL